MSKQEKKEFPLPNYNLLSERLRLTVPQELQCALFCGGLKCKYEGIEQWRLEDRELDVIYSNWITNNLIAMSRPNSHIVRDLVDIFKKHKIKSIFNLQQLGEHSKCGRGLEKSGFAYDPQVFMENNIYYYNFQWKDYSSISQHFLLDIIKVLSFSLKEGKAAIHCHAGLGRTGVLIACYLLYCKEIDSPANVINYIRMKRPHSIQTRQQIETVFTFHQHLLNIIRCKSPTIELIVSKQRKLLHGYEYRQFKNIPKLIYTVVERLKEEERKESQLPLENMDLANFNDTSKVIETLLTEYRLLSKEFQSKLEKIKQETTENIFDKLEKEDDILIHSCLLFQWFNDLKEPFFNKTTIITIILKENADEALLKFDTFRRDLFLYLMAFISQLLQTRQKYTERLLNRFIAEFCQQSIKIGNNSFVPKGVLWNQLRKGTYHTIYAFVSSFLLINDNKI